MRIEHVTLYRLKLPLRRPYKLALGEVRALDTLIAVASDEDGRSGFGEATYLPGYSHETIEAGWRAVRAVAESIVGTGGAEAKAAVRERLLDAPFTATALTTAVEMLEGHPLLTVRTRTRVPLLAIVNAMDAAGIEREIEEGLEQGYGTFKVKVGFDRDADLARVRLIQGLLSGRARIRIDGNQGFSSDEAVGFARALSPEGIELFEQPCAAGDWEAAKAVAEASPVPMMLDESIYGLADIERAAALGAAAYVKFKLMKAGGLDRLVEALERIKALGLKPVLGNGVASDIGCWMEACVARAHVAGAGEMNGFLKPGAGVFRSPLSVENGSLVLEPERPSLIGAAALSALAEDTASFPGSRSRARA